MIKRRIVATLLVAATLSLPAPAFANHGEPIYTVTFYSDSSYTEVVGQEFPYCTSYGIGYNLGGRSTNYMTYALAGYCANEGRGTYLEPI